MDLVYPQKILIAVKLTQKNQSLSIENHQQ
jgi:hypothetical protein